MKLPPPPLVIVMRCHGMAALARHTSSTGPLGVPLTWATTGVG